MDKIIRICDITHKREFLADERLHFGLDGVAYEIDLCSDDSSKLHKVLAPYMQAARRIPNSRAASKSPKRTDFPAIRAWATEHMPDRISTRGRIPTDVLAAYDEQHWQHL